MAGLRMEHTSLRYTGRNYDDETDKTTKTDRVTSSYVNFLPSILVKWDVMMISRYAVLIHKL